MIVHDKASRRWFMVGTPLAFAVLTAVHPMVDPWTGDALHRWMLVHTAQLGMTVLLAYVVWLMVDGLCSRSATVVRVALPVFLVALSAFDAVAGLATGLLVGRAEEQSGAAREATLAAADHLFYDNWLAGNLSVLGGVTAISWTVIAVALALALRGSGADRVTVAWLGAAVLFAQHAAPFGTIGLLALTVAVWRSTDVTRNSTPSNPAIVVREGNRS